MIGLQQNLEAKCVHYERTNERKKFFCIASVQSELNRDFFLFSFLGRLYSRLKTRERERCVKNEEKKKKKKKAKSKKIAEEKRSGAKLVLRKGCSMKEIVFVVEGKKIKPRSAVEDVA